jgi:predicted DNA-binding transcriptional regulator AlpA
MNRAESRQSESGGTARRDLDEVPPASNMNPMSTEPTPEPAADDEVRGPVMEAALPLLLDSAEAARLLGIGRSTFYRLDVTGLVPRAIRLSKIRRWSRPELRRWVEAGCPPRGRWETTR